MGGSEERLQRLLEAELESCCAEDVRRRLDELDRLAGRIPADTSRDRAALNAAGDETRHCILRLLSASDRALYVCEVTPLVDVSGSAVSHALADLADAGLVTRRKDRTWHYYDTTPRAERLLSALDAAGGETA
jgi:DNA-binding transcriptional ArsR family regulator